MCKLSNVLKLALSTLVVSNVSPLYAGQVTYADDGFTTNSVLTATDLNTRFNESKAEINDNDARISNIESNTAPTIDMSVFNHSLTKKIFKLPATLDDAAAMTPIDQLRVLRFDYPSSTQTRVTSEDYCLQSATCTNPITTEFRSYVLTEDTNGVSVTETIQYRTDGTPAPTTVLTEADAAPGNLVLPTFLTLQSSVTASPGVLKSANTMVLGKSIVSSSKPTVNLMASGTVVTKLTLLAVNQDVSVAAGNYTGCALLEKTIYGKAPSFFDTATSLNVKSWLPQNYSSMQWLCPGVGLVLEQFSNVVSAEGTYMYNNTNYQQMELTQSFN